MEGGNQRLTQRPTAQHASDALRHLCRRFVGERNSQDRIWLNAFILN
jgi:hypothetical protein